MPRVILFPCCSPEIRGAPTRKEDLSRSVVIHAIVACALAILIGTVATLATYFQTHGMIGWTALAGAGSALLTGVSTYVALRCLLQPKLAPTHSPPQNEHPSPPAITEKQNMPGDLPAADQKVRTPTEVVQPVHHHQAHSGMQYWMPTPNSIPKDSNFLLVYQKDGGSALQIMFVHATPLVDYWLRYECCPSLNPMPQEQEIKERFDAETVHSMTEGLRGMDYRIKDKEDTRFYLSYWSFKKFDDTRVCGVQIICFATPEERENFVLTRLEHSIDE